MDVLNKQKSNEVPYDPIGITKLVKYRVTKRINDTEYRKYFRFRGGRWYGGIATADVIGCNLQCKFCWAWYFKNRYDIGDFYSPYKAFLRLREIARGKGYKYLRLSGGEPTISKDHIVELIKLVEDAGFTFILETNGILIGYNSSFAKELARFSNLIVRVSFKGTSEDEFVKLTGAKGEGFELQFKAVENLLDAGFKAGKDLIVASMISFSSEDNIKTFLKRLASIDIDLLNIDWEVVFLYPHVKKLLDAYNLKPLRAIEPNRIPDRMV
jgi:uncharacterized Fe-S cluster-containing radical SAM superfamily protein